MRYLSILLFLTAGTLEAQNTPEPPQVLILAGNGASLVRAGSELALTAKPGQVLFTGDALRGAATFLSCTGKSEQTLSTDGDVLFDVKGQKLRAGKIAATRPSDGCSLPPLLRTIVATQQHAGAAIAMEASREVVAQTFQQRLQQLPESQRTRLMTDLAPLDQAIAANPKDNVKRLARVAALETAGLDFDAAEELGRVSRDWPDAAEMRSRVFVLEEKGGKTAVSGSKQPEPEAEGDTYALLVGISSFQDKNIIPLQYAHEDALELTKLLKSPRAGAIPEDNVVTLVNEKATRGAIQSAIETHLKGRAKKNDTILLFIASHGTMVGKKGYIIAYDTSAEDPATSGIPMDDIRKLFETQLSEVKRLYLYVDVCHAGNVGQISAKPDDKLTETALSSREVSMFGMLAAQKGQVAYEGVNYGGGHGAFSYFLMRALNSSEADVDGNGKVSMSELADYVHDQVQAATLRAQTPKQIGDSENEPALALTGKPGIELKAYTGPSLLASRGLTSTVQQPGQALAAALNTRALKYQDIEGLIKQYDDALQKGRILQSDEQSAFLFLDAIRARRPDGFREQAEKLRVALEDRGQQVLLKYLAGEAAPQNRDDFVRGEAYFEAALPLAPESLFLQSRAYFCQGRAAMFAKDYVTAKTLLERSVGLDPDRAYAYNALGIISLERADYDGAIPAFREANKRAPYWAYPMHNLALAYMEKGDYESAIQTYLRAMQLAPKVPYLPYNLGLLYQRMNRPRDAEAQYRKALAMDANNAQILNALGALKAETGHRADAEQFYKRALAADSASLPARYNLGQLLASDPKRASEAATLWQENLARDAQHLPSRIALARYLASTGNKADAAREYEVIVAAKPDYVAARLALVDVKPEDAIAQLEFALKIQPDNPEILERAGKAYKSAGRTADAEASLRKALALVTDGASRKRIKQELK
jgi:tetratricopeptide (TPR) repeat protein